MSIGVADLDGLNGNDIAVADENIGQVGELLNTGGGVFPATATTFNANNSPASIALGEFTNHSTAINDIAVANFSGGISILTNTTGAGNFGTPNHLLVSPEQDTAGIASGNLDGTGVSLVAVNELSNSVTIFPNGTTSGAVTLTSGIVNPIAVFVADFRGPSSNPDIAVLNSNGTIQFFLNPNGGAGDFNFTPAGAPINVGSGAVAMTVGGFYTAGGTDSAVIRNVTTAGVTTGILETLKNISTAGAINFAAAMAAP